jgi:sulfur-oxidizing protein SoxY
MTRHALRRRAALLLAFGLTVSATLAARAETPDVWPDISRDLFPGKSVGVDQTAIALEAPARAEDAAIVPMTLRFKNDGVRRATLVIDQNPMPMAAAFEIGPNAGVSFIETRVRVNSYTNVHAVAETGDGSLHAEVKFVKAAGGCSAPAGKNMDEAAANLGKMKYREFTSQSPGRREAQIMIRHPNASGMQMDQVTHLYIPAHYVEKVEVRQGTDLIFSMEGGISLSEDPIFRFDYKPNGAKTISVEARDSKGVVFKGEWPIGDAS